MREEFALKSPLPLPPLVKGIPPGGTFMPGGRLCGGKLLAGTCVVAAVGGLVGPLSAADDAEFDVGGKNLLILLCNV